jgi:hypothetical protein
LFRFKIGLFELYLLESHSSYARQALRALENVIMAHDFGSPFFISMFVISPYFYICEPKNKLIIKILTVKVKREVREDFLTIENFFENVN